MAIGVTPKDSGGIPVAEVYVPGTVNPIALKGSPNTNTDNNNNTSTAVAVALDPSIVQTTQLQLLQSGNANGTIQNIFGMGSVLFEVSMSSYTGTVNFEGASPNSFYVPIYVNQVGTNTVTTTAVGNATTSTVLYELSTTTGFNFIRARTSGASAGSVTISSYASPTPSGPRVVAANLYDGTNLISSMAIGGFNYLRTANIQDVELSAGNGSTTNLASGASFTGTSVSTLGVASIQVCLFSDQPCTIQVQQAQENPGVNWNIVDSWTYAASSNAQDATRTVQALGASVRTVVTNNGGSTTTVLRLTTVLCPVADPLPRTLTQLGNLRVAVQEPLVLFNGTTNDQWRNNLDNIVVLASAARTTTQTQADQTNYNHRGIIVVLDMTVVGTGSVTLEIDGKDPVSGKYYAILTGALITTNTTNIYRVYPGLTAVANATVSDILPRTWRVKVTANNANSATYSVGAILIL